MIAPANPVVPGFFPDPSVCRADDGYYLACSSFEYFPGVPIHHSADLQTWTLVANALDRPEQLPLAGRAFVGRHLRPDPAPPRRPVLARDDQRVDRRSRHLHGRRTRAARGRIRSRSTARRGSIPTSPGTPSGTCWLTYSELGGDGLDAVSGQIKQVRLDPHSGRPLEQPRALWSGTGLQFPEAPHLYEIDGTWYLLIAEGGTGPGHAVSIARGPSPSGPFEGCPRQPDPQPPQHRPPGAEHRPRRPRAGARRLVVDGPARASGARAPSPRSTCSGARPSSRRCAGSTAGPWWSTVPLERRREDRPSATTSRPPSSAPSGSRCARAPTTRWSLTEQPGSLVLHARDGSIDTRRAGLRRAPPAAHALHRARGDRRRPRPRRPGRPHRRVALLRRSRPATGEVRCHARVGPFTRTTALHPAANGAVLRIDAVPDPAGHGPDVLRLGLEEHGEHVAIAELDGRYLSTEVAGGFTGRVIGLYAAEGHGGLRLVRVRGLGRGLSPHRVRRRARGAGSCSEGPR